jgi:CheY-like chemotaxis protein
MVPQPVNINDLISGSVKMFKHLLPPDIVVRMNFAPEVPTINADPTMTDQVLINLVVNARDAMPRGGELTISTSVVEIDTEYVRLHPEAAEGKHICLAVNDTGCGMDAPTMARIFEPFFTTKPSGKGTGLGLATVYGIVRQHHGWIEVQSILNKGTAFRVFFPCSKLIQPPQAAPKQASRRPGPSTILVVEDESDVAQFISALLRAHNFKVLEASSALQAMEIWNQEQGEIDLLLTDVVLGKGMSGFELAENLTALRPQLNVVYTSGYSAETFAHAAELKEGFNYLPKPYPPPRLLNAVRRHLPQVAQSSPAAAAAN